MLKNKPHLSAGVKLEDIFNAFTDPNKKFQFPIEGLQVGTDQETKNAIYMTGVIIGLSIIAGFMILNTKK
tara:strand:+ start:3720 stop:3929 length:210 start_codon:yes stop_codon:yes gene_type:complete